MSDDHQQPASNGPSRREFLKTSAVAATGAITGSLALNPAVHAAGSDILEFGLIGCGGRGSGAAVNALTADPNTQLVAMADIFEDKLQAGLRGMKGTASQTRSPLMMTIVSLVLMPTRKCWPATSTWW